MIKLYKNRRYDAAYYVLPFAMMNEAINSKYLTYQERLQFLEIAYLTFMEQLKQNESNKINPLITEKYRKTAIGTTFGDSIFLKRCINTVIGIAVAINMDLEKIGLERVGTHCLECFFGYMRMCSHGDHSLDMAIRVAIKSLLITKYCHEMNYQIPIQTRVNTGGQKITKSKIEEKLYNEIECEPTVFHDVFSKLAQHGESIEIDNKEIIDHVIEMMQSRKNKYSDSVRPSSFPSKLSGIGPLARYKNSVITIPSTSSPLEAFYEISEELKQKYKTMTERQKGVLFSRWKDMCSGKFNESQTRGNKMQNSLGVQTAGPDFFNKNRIQNN